MKKIISFLLGCFVALNLSISVANSAANETVSPSIAPFADDTMLWLVKPLLTATVENKTIEP